MMHVLLIADGRSPITQNWAQGLLTLGYKVSLISTYLCSPINRVELAAILPVAFSALSGMQVVSGEIGHDQIKRKVSLSRFRPWLQKVRYLFGPLSLSFYTRHFQHLVNEINPDLVHALRIPFEGMLATATPYKFPLIISTWGNDLTLHAYGSGLMKTWTHKTLRRANALISDTQRDLQLALEWGLKAQAPKLEAPGNGGIDLHAMEALKKTKSSIPDYFLSEGPFIINPRGFRPGSLHQDVFFKTIPLIIKEFPNARFLCPAMLHQTEALHWIEKLEIAANIILLPYLTQKVLWEHFFKSQVYVSLSSHDGTPNTLLESMACGCLPICGDTTSLREWITSGENGWLVNPLDVNKAASAILSGLRDADLRRRAYILNRKILKERADIGMVRAKIKDFYEMVTK